MQAPELAKAGFVEAPPRADIEICVMKTELLYSLELRVAGQVDLLMRNDSSE
jgi:hypothetical protein